MSHSMTHSAPAHGNHRYTSVNLSSHVSQHRHYLSPARTSLTVHQCARSASQFKEALVCCLGPRDVEACSGSSGSVTPGEYASDVLDG